MTFGDDAIGPSPWLSVWFKPRSAIERIVADKRWIWPIGVLACLGGMSSAAAALIGLGFIGTLLNWQVLLGCALVGIGMGAFQLFFFAPLIANFGEMMGGNAATAAIRRVLAWSALPWIPGLVIALAVVGELFLFGDDGAAAHPLTALPQFVFFGCGLWSIIVLLLMLSRVERFGFWRTVGLYLCCSVVLLSPLLVISPLVFRTFVFQPFNVPAGSMAPTVLVGDLFFANKFAYGYSRFSLPFAPRVFSGRLFAAEPKPGDVVVFAFPKDESVTYIKRVVAFGGDRVQLMGGLLYINGGPVVRKRLADFAGDDPCGSSAPARVKRWRETLPNGATYETLDCVDNGFYDNTPVYTVPAGHAFVLGDNRDNSTDSRVLSAMGYIPLENIFGRAAMIYASRDSKRIGIMVR
jgi:signal peptidase I